MRTKPHAFNGPNEKMIETVLIAHKDSQKEVRAFRSCLRKETCEVCILLHQIYADAYYSVLVIPLNLVSRNIVFPFLVVRRMSLKEDRM